VISIASIIHLFKNNKIANRFVNVLSVDIIVKGSNVLLIPVYLHLMTQDQVGTYNYLFSFIQMMSVILNFGFYVAQSKLYHDFDGENRKEFIFSINILLIFSLLVVLIPLYLSEMDYNLANLIFNNQIAYEKYRFIILLAVLTSVGSYMLLNYFLTSENIKQVQLYNIMRLALSNGIVILILLYSDKDKVFIRFISFYLIEISIYLFFAYKYFSKSKICFNLSHIRKILFLSLPVFFLSIISTIQAFSDKFFIQRQSSEMSILAVYTLGTTIAATFSLIIQSFQSIWLPIFFKEKNLKENFRITSKMVFLITIIFLILSVLIIIVTKLSLIFGIIPIEYKYVLVILPFLLLSQIISGVVVMFSNYFSYFEKVYLGAITGGSIYFLCFGLNYFLIPRYGIPGAIASMLLGNVVLLLLVYFVVMRLYKKNLALYYQN
jgi:O-antigen/teichoic acid export membrane protein